jgi:hypothetical protein
VNKAGLDYAANAVVYWPGEALRNQFVQSCTASGKDPDAVLAAFLGVDGEAERFWSDAYSNLKSGKVRLVFVADRIPPELQRIVEFLNERMAPTEVLGVEIMQYAGEGLTAHMPRVIGQTTAAMDVKAGRKYGRVSYPVEPLSDTEFLACVSEHADSRMAPSMAKVLQWLASESKLSTSAERKGQVQHITTVTTATATNRFLSIFAPTTKDGTRRDGRIHHNAFRTLLGEDDRHEFWIRLSSIPGLGWTPEEVAKAASIPTTSLMVDGAAEHLVAALQWALRRVN